MLHAPSHQKKEIADYVEWQSNKAEGPPVKVLHLEIMKTESVFGREHVAWDVHTDEPGRWWVITNPTNLYSQRDFQSLDYTFSFHIGVTARMASRDAKEAPDSQKGRLLSCWRRWENAAEAIDNAKEAADFQSVGMMCREALLDLVRVLQREVVLPPKVERPKAADFLDWFDLIANYFAGGKRNERVRGYIKSNATELWQLANWVTHSSRAVRYEADLVLDATEHFFGFVSSVVMQFEADSPETCPHCNSYRIVAVYEPDLNIEPPYVNYCEACGWHDYVAPEEEEEDEAITAPASK